MINYVVVLPYFAECQTYKVPLVLKQKPDYLKGMLNLPGGKIEHLEIAVDAAVRELKEETGLEYIGDFDGMCDLEPEVMGTIQGTKSYIYCVKVPVSVSQELNPGKEETEEVQWYEIPELFNEYNLMPNLRITIPLMLRGVKRWMITDIHNDWRHSKEHKVKLYFDGLVSLDVTVPSVGFLKATNE